MTTLFNFNLPRDGRVTYCWKSFRSYLGCLGLKQACTRENVIFWQPSHNSFYPSLGPKKISLEPKPHHIPSYSSQFDVSGLVKEIWSSDPPSTSF